jgi:hypothetical protein
VQNDIAGGTSWVLRNKELIAVVGVFLGLVPKFLDIATQASRRQKESAALLLQRQRLEVIKLRHDIEKVRRDLGEPPLNVRVTAEMALTEAVAAAGRAAVQHEAEHPKSTTDAAPHWVLRHPGLAKPLLLLVQIALGSLMGFSVLITIFYPIAMLADPKTRNAFGGTEIGVEFVYLLMSMAFLALYRKVRRWRRADAAGPPPDVPGGETRRATVMAR